MTNDSGAAQRRIMDQLDDSNRLPMLNVHEGDIGVLFGGPLAGLLVGSLLGIELLAVGLAAVGLLVGVAIVYAAPETLTAWAWLCLVSRHLLAQPAVTYSNRPGSDQPTTDGGAVQYRPFVAEESAQSLTHFERAWPGVHAIERDDGSMEAFLELRPANMDFALSENWMEVQTAAESFANAELEWPLTLYATTRPFPAEDIVAQLDDRLDDADVEANPVFGDLIEEYRDERPDELADTREFRYYLGVEVDRMDVYRRYETEPTPGERLTAFPLVGVLFRPFVTRRRQLDEAELRAALFEKLDTRIGTVRSEFVDNMAGWSARRLPTVELVCLPAAFWNGETDDGDGGTERLLPTTTALGHSRRDSTEAES